MNEQEASVWNWHWQLLGLQQANKLSTEHVIQHTLLRWRLDPVIFAIEALGVVLKSYQVAILLDLADVPIELYDFYSIDPDKTKRQVLVPSGHGLGKTRVLAVAIWWHLITHPFSMTLCTAPTSDQLTGRLWGECRKMKRALAKHFPDFADQWEVQNAAITNKNPDYADWSCVARTARPEKPEGLQGAHALDIDDEFGDIGRVFGREEKTTQSGGMLIIIEEASGVDIKIREVLDGALSEHGARLLAMGNPTRPDDWFAKDSSAPDRFAVHHLDCRMSNRNEVTDIPYRDLSGKLHHFRQSGFVDPKYWNDMLKECDGDEDSDRFRVRVRGMFPRSAFDQVIKSTWYDDALGRERHTDSKRYPIIISLDFGLTSDKHAKHIIQGHNHLDGEEWLPKDKPEEVTLDAFDRAVEDIKLYNAKQYYVIGDSNGVGRGAMEMMACYARENPRLNITVIHFNAGQGANDKKRYFRKRDEMWHKHFRRWMASQFTSLLDIPGLTLKTQLTTSGFYDSHNRVQVETKKEMKKRGYDSPNSGDALAQAAYCFYIHVEPRFKTASENQSQPAVQKQSIPDVFKKHFNRIHNKNQQGSIQ
jgi:hypothetical protein